MFRDRLEAGRLLAGALIDYPRDRTRVIALAGGGVVVGRAIADALGAPLDVMVLEPITPPRDPDVAVGWVSAHGVARLNHERLRKILLPPGYLALETEKRREVAQLREIELRDGLPKRDVNGRVVVLVTDGIEDDTQIAAAVADLRARQGPPSWIAVASPVVWPGPRKRLPSLVDELVLLHSPAAIGTVGQDYRDFPRVDDTVVRELLETPGI